MHVLFEYCAGLDIHKKTVVACRVYPTASGALQRDTAHFVTTTAGILELSDWLGAAAITHVALESTGSYWKPIFNLLEPPSPSGC